MQSKTQRNKPNNPNTSKNHRAPRIFLIFEQKPGVYRCEQSNAKGKTQRNKHTHTPTDEIQLNLKRKRAKECKGMQRNAKECKGIHNETNPTTPTPPRITEPRGVVFFFFLQKPSVYRCEQSNAKGKTQKTTHTHTHRPTKYN